MLQASHGTQVLISLSAVECTGILCIWYKACQKSMDWLHIALNSTHPHLNHQTLCVRTWKYVLFYPLATEKLIPSHVSNPSPLSSFFLLLVHFCHRAETMDGTQWGQLLHKDGNLHNSKQKFRAQTASFSGSEKLTFASTLLAPGCVGAEVHGGFSGEEAIAPWVISRRCLNSVVVMKELEQRLITASKYYGRKLDTFVQLQYKLRHEFSVNVSLNIIMK